MSSLIQQYTRLFDSVGESTTPIIVTSEKQAETEANGLIKQYKQAKEWSAQSEVLNKGIALVKGGACQYKAFITSVPLFSEFISPSVLSPRSTLVKNGCLLTTYLAKNLKSKFDSTAELLIPTLFQPTTNATGIISQSCRLTILNISKYCQTKRVLLVLLDNLNSKSKIHRSIVSESLEIVCKTWPDSVLYTIPNFESQLISLSTDASSEVRQHARTALQFYKDRLGNHGDQTEVISPKLTLHSSFDLFNHSPAKFKPLNFSIDNEYEFLDSLRYVSLQKSRDLIIEHSSEISSGIVSIISTSTNENLIQQIISHIGTIISIIPQSFESSLSQLIYFLLSRSKTDLSSSSALRSIAPCFPPLQLLDISLRFPKDYQLLSFISKVISHDDSFIPDATPSLIDSLLSLCCTVYTGCSNTRETALSISLLNKISQMNRTCFNSFASTASDDERHVLKSLHLASSPRKIIQKLPQVSANPELRLGQILQRVMSDKVKFDSLADLEKFFERTNWTTFASSIPILTDLMHSPYFMEVDNIIAKMIENVDRNSLEEAAFTNFQDEKNGKSADFFGKIIARSSKEVAKYAHESVKILGKLAQSKELEDRKIATDCLAAFRKAIGPEFDDELEQLPPNVKRIVQLVCSNLC